MKLYLKFIFVIIMICKLSCIEVCPESNDPPQKIEIDETKTINPINFSGKSYISSNVGNKIFLTENTHENFATVTSGSFSDSTYCPENFKIPLQSDFQEAIDNLGSNAYSVFTDKNGFNMQEGKYYLTNTPGKEGTGFNKMLLYIDGNSLKFADETPFRSVVRCVLNIPKVNLIAPFTDRDLELNENFNVKAESNYLNGYLWKIDDKIFKTESISYAFDKSKEHKLEFWGKYINGSDVYLCEIIYVNKKQISSSQTFSDSKIKIISTNFKMPYEKTLHFSHSNYPIAPRDNGGYYIAISDTLLFLHILSYDKDDKLLKDFNTTESAYPHDITATDYGFAVYMLDSKNSNHSYLSLYNKNFELINTVLIMNNQKTDDYLKDSNLEKQIIKYEKTESGSSPVYGMRFMYRPDNGKLIYSRGRIFLIFCHYNYFLDAGGHTGDTVVTFNDYLLDMDFGITWGASHSLIQSATFDNKKHFWTAALSDAYPEGIKVEYTSKKEFTNSFDPVNNKYNTRKSYSTNDLAGYIKGYRTGPADGKLGGILFFEKYDLYCLVYAKTPNYSDDSAKNNKNIIFVTTWKYEDGVITNKQTYEIKVFSTGNVMQLRAGKYGDSNIIIIYAETDQMGHNGYGNIPKGTKPKVFVLSVPSMIKIINDVAYDNLLMNTNEDLRTFRDGVLIWGAADQQGNLIIHKIGTPSLTDKDDEYLNEVITKEDLTKIENNGNNDPTENGSNWIFGIMSLIILQMFLALEFVQ